MFLLFFADKNTFFIFHSVLLKDFVVFYKKMFRQMLSNDQDAAAALDEEKQVAANTNQWNQAHVGTSSDDIVTGWEALLSLISALYKNRSDSAIAWWTEPDLAQFIRLSADVWTPRFLARFLKFLAALSCGPNSATQANHVLNSESAGSLGNVNWSTFFRTLNSYVERLSQTDIAFELSQVESNLIIAFLDLVSEVVKSSINARRILCENQNFRALDTLFYLLVGRLQVELKASLFHTIAAFCTPPIEGLDLANHIWQYVEQSQIISTTSDYNFDGKMTGGIRGIVFDIREIESSMKTYPETFAFLNLLKMLLASTNSTGADSIFDTLGMPNRAGGVRPYISFVIEEVFLKIDEMHFVNPQEKGKLTSMCLEIFHLCLERFDITDSISYLASGVIVQQHGYSPLRSLGLQPGFDILCRLFSGSRFGQGILNVIENSSDEGGAKDTSSYNALRVIYFALQIQRSFLEQIAPSIVESKDAIFLKLPSAMSGLDSHLTMKKNVIIKIGSLINSDYDSVALLSVAVISLLSKSSLFAGIDSSEPFHGSNRLVGVFESSPESNRILKGYADRLLVEGVEVLIADNILFSGSQDTQREASSLFFDPSNLKHSVGHCIRLEILDMLLWNVSSQSSPNIAHFFLGLLSKDTSKLNPLMLKISCFPSIVTLLFQGDDNRQFFVSHPILAEKIYHLIYLVCADPRNASQVLRYLRNEHDFFARQLANFHPVKDTEEFVPGGMDSLVVRLHQCAWLLKSVAMELHVTSLTGQRSQSMRLLNLLFSSNEYQDAFHRESSQLFEQPLTLVSGILQALNLTETSMVPLDLSQTIFSWVQLASFMKDDERGTEIFDIPSLYSQLTSFANHLENSGTIIQAGGRIAALEMVSQILDHILSKNEFQQVSSARFHSMQAWCYLIRIAIKGYFDLLPDEVRERRIFELLSGLLQRVGSNSISLSIGACVSQTVLALISRLDQDRKNRQNYEIDSNLGNQMDAFNSAILQGILEGIQVPGSSSMMRGNYYSALITFINFINPETQRLGLEARVSLKETFTIISKLPNRFWDILCGDASDSEPAWQTVAFSTLASLCEAANWDHVRSNSQSHVMVNYLAKRNSLGHFIRTIKQVDDHYLQSIISSNSPDEMDQMLYAFNSKMTLLLRIAETRFGSERLLEYGILESLTECQYLDQLPSSERSCKHLFFQITFYFY